MRRPSGRESALESGQNGAMKVCLRPYTVFQTHLHRALQGEEEARGFYRTNGSCTIRGFYTISRQKPAGSDPHKVAGLNDGAETRGAMIRAGPSEAQYEVLG